MDWQNGLHYFVFNDQAAIDEDVQTERLLENQAFVFDWNHQLIERRNSLQVKFVDQAAFVYAFNQAGTFVPVNFDGSTNYFGGKQMGFGEVSMHCSAIFAILV